MYTLTPAQQETLRLFLDRYYVATEPREGDTTRRDLSRMVRDYRLGNDVIELAGQMGWGDESVEYLDVLYEAIRSVFALVTVTIRVHKEDYYYVQPRWEQVIRGSVKDFSRSRQARVLAFVRERKLRALVD